MKDQEHGSFKTITIVLMNHGLHTEATRLNAFLTGECHRSCVLVIQPEKPDRLSRVRDQIEEADMVVIFSGPPVHDQEITQSLAVSPKTGQQWILIVPSIDGVTHTATPTFSAVIGELTLISHATDRKYMVETFCKTRC